MRSERPGADLPCADVAELLPGMVDGTATADAQALGHVGSCLRCQAELAQYRRLQRALRRLRPHGVEPPVGLLADVLASLSDPRHQGEPSQRARPSRRHGRTAAYLGGLAVATAAAGAAVVLRSGRGPSRAS